MDEHEARISRLENKLARFEAIYFSKNIQLEGSDSGKIIDMFAETAARLINAETVAVPTLSPDNRLVQYGHVYGKHHAALYGVSLPLEDAGLCGWVLENRQPLMTNNLSDDPRVAKEMATELGITCAVLAPLISRGKIIGGLSAFNKTDGSMFTEDNAADLERLAEYAALAIDQAQLMEELASEKHKLDSIFEGARDGILLISTDGAMLKANRAVQDFIELKAEEALGVKVQELCAERPMLGEFFDWEAKAAAGKRCWEVLGCEDALCAMHGQEGLRCWSVSEGRCQRTSNSNGNTSKEPMKCANCEVFSNARSALCVPRQVKLAGKTLQATSTPVINEATKDVAWEIMVFHDITAEKEVERQRKEFVSMIAHDMKAPLSCIMGYCEMIALENDINIIKGWNALQDKNAGYLLKLVRDYLDLSVIEAGRIHLRPSMISIGELAHRTADYFMAQARSKGIKLDCVVEAGLPDIMADAELMQRVIGNLISNSLQFVQDGGNINVRTSRAPGGKIEIRVEDDGPGIPPESLPNIFNIYSSGSNSRETGIGLSIVKELTKAHGGSVSVVNGEERGAVFSVLLPGA